MLVLGAVRAIFNRIRVIMENEMPKPTIYQIKELMRNQKYENYKVADAQNFPQLLPVKGKIPRDADVNWFKANFTVKGERIYDLAGESKPSAPTPPPNLITANVMTRSRKNTINSKSAECSNFAKHAIGTMLQVNDITEHYNIVLAGIMGGRHNIAILVPKNDSSNLADELPQGSLIVDPWAFGMGKDFNNSFAC